MTDRPYPGYVIRILLIFILLVATVLRLIHLGDFSFSNDELSALYRIQYERFWELVSKGFYVDGHPGGIQVFLFYWVKLTGISEFLVRVPFAMAGVLAVYMVYLVAKRWFHPTAGLFSALLIAVLQFPVLYSQIARPYATGVLFVLMTAWFWTRLVFDWESLSNRSRSGVIAGFALSTVLCMYNHYFSFLVAAIIGLTGMFFIKRNNLYWYLGAGIVSAVLFLPHVLITLNHLKIGGVGLWLGKPGPLFLFHHIFYLFNESYLMLTVILILVIWAVWRFCKTSGPARFRIIAVLWFLLPMLTGFVYSRLVNPVLQHSVLVFSFPFLLFFLFSFMEPVMNRRMLAAMVVLFLIAIFSLVIEKKYYNTQHFGEFRGIAAKVAEWDRQLGRENITRAINVNNPWYIHYYLERYHSDAAFAQYENRGGMDLLDLKHVAEQSRTPFFLYAWTKPAPSETEDIVRVFYPYIHEKIDYGGLSAIGLYGKEKPNGITEEPQPICTILNGFESPGRWNLIPEKMDTSRVFEGRYSCRIDASTEYGPAFDTLFNKISSQPVRSIKVSVWAHVSPGFYKTPLVISVDDTRGRNYIWGAMNMEYFLDENIWGKVVFNYDLPRLRSMNDRLKIYVWNPEKNDFYIDALEIRFYEE